VRLRACAVATAGLGAAFLLAGCGGSGSSAPPPASTAPNLGLVKLLPGVANKPWSKKAVSKSQGPPVARMKAFYREVAPWVLAEVDPITGGIQLVPTNTGTWALQVNTGLASIPIGREICRITKAGVKAEEIPKVEQIMVNGYDPGSVIGTGPLAQWPQDWNAYILC
jgi:hypothetical protein